MRIGIDISQIVYSGTGVSEYVNNLVAHLIRKDTKNEYVLFLAHRKATTLSRSLPLAKFCSKNSSRCTLVTLPIPISFLEIMWNKLHIAPIEWFIGNIDVFFSSDWVEPPVKNAKKITTIHDLSVLKVPETFDKKIVKVHKRKLSWVKKECSMVLCDSYSTKKDVHQLLNIDNNKLFVVYPGLHKSVTTNIT